MYQSLPAEHRTRSAAPWSHLIHRGEPPCANPHAPRHPAAARHATRLRRTRLIYPATARSRSPRSSPRTSPLCQLLQQDRHGVKMLNGQPGVRVSRPARPSWSRPTSVVCRASDVDISSHSCQLTFGASRSTWRAPAHELYATIAEAASRPTAPPARCSRAFTSHLHHRPQAVTQKAGGGASCTFTPGP